MKLSIVCRGSKREGLGHLTRARTFARVASRQHDVEVVAICEPDLDALLADLRCPVRFVRVDGDVLPHVEAHRAEAVVLDVTHLEERTFSAIRDFTRNLVSLSPVFDRMDRVDALFTRAARTEPIAGVRLFAGLQYAVFGEQCSPIDDSTYRRAMARRAMPIAVCMGGTDAANKTLHVVRSLVERQSPSVVWVLLGEGYAHSYNALAATARGNARHEVILATSRSMWQVLSNCALAILAGGLTTVEAVYAGLPSINLFERREHWDMVTELFDAGVCLNGGLFSERTLTTMTRMLDMLDLRRDRLLSMRLAGRGRVDDKGSERILEKLQEFIDRREEPSRLSLEGLHVSQPY